MTSRVILFGIPISSAILVTAILLFFGVPTTTSAVENENDGKLVFAAAGDWSCDSDTEATIEGVQRHNPELVLALGDLAYTTNDASCWFEVSEPIDHLVKFVLGNHDDETPLKYEQHMTHYNLTVPYYSFDRENVHFLILSTEQDTYTTTDAQYMFAKSDLESASTNEDIDWITVSFHKPLYTRPNTSHGEYNVFKTVYQPLFDQHDVDLVLTGHIHTYQRSLPLKYGGTTAPIITDTNYNEYINPDGTIYMNVGTGGYTLRQFTGTKPYIISSDDTHHGFLLVEVKNDITSTVLEGKFYANGEYPSYADSFKIIKGEPPVAGGIFYDVPYPGNSASGLGSSTFRVGEQAYGSASQLIGKSLKEWTVYLKKTGSASGNVNAVVRNSGDAIVATFNPIVDASTLSTTFAPKLFTLTSPYTIQYGDRIMIQYTGPGSVDISTWTTDKFDGGNTRRTTYKTSYSSGSGSDVVGTMSTAGSGSDPSLTLTGSNYYDVPSSSSLQVQQYSVAVQFNTCESTLPSGNTFIINKGGSGTDAPGKNLNYGVWMRSTGQTYAGFEAVDGTDYLLKPSKSYNDCQDHYAINTFDGSTLKLYVDGELVASQTGINEMPDNTGTQPLRIGANSLQPDGFFKGTIDEARLYNRAITEQEVIDATFNGVFKYEGQVLYLPFQ